MKSLQEFLNNINESKISEDNIFFKIFKSKSLNEFKTKVLELKSMVTAKPVKTEKDRYYIHVDMPTRNPSANPSVRLWGYKISSAVSNENKYFIAFAVKNEKDPESDNVAEFEKYPKLYIGNNKKLIEYKWNTSFNDVGFDKHGGKKGINAAILPTNEIYVMPNELVSDCIEDLQTFGRTKTWKTYKK